MPYFGFSDERKFIMYTFIKNIFESYLFTVGLSVLIYLLSKLFTRFMKVVKKQRFELLEKLKDARDSTPAPDDYVVRFLLSFHHTVFLFIPVINCLFSLVIFMGTLFSIFADEKFVIKFFLYKKKR